MACLAVGVWGVIHEETSRHPSVTIIAVYFVAMTAPALLGALLLGRTGTLFSRPLSQPSSSSSPSPSPEAGEP
jgi:hypothetical protein